MLTTQEIANRDKKLGFYLMKLKPFLESVNQSKKRMPTWEEIRIKFGHEFGKSGPKIWFKNVVESYNKEFVKVGGKRNRKYNPILGIALKAKYDAINKVSWRGKRAIHFSIEEGKYIASMV